MNLTDRVALVTGGSEGIGFAIAKALIAKGGKATLLARNEQRLREAAEKLGCDFIVGDVGDEETADAAVAEVAARHGRFDILVNNAGFGRFAPLVDMKTEDFVAVHRTNVLGAFFMGRAAARHFVQQGSGELINISSTSGLSGGAGATAYSSSKFALKGMTECWRAELRRHDVRVMLVNPSEVLTSFSKRAGYEQQPSPKKLRASEIADAIIGALQIDSRGFIPEFSVFATNPYE
jgi:3-oxoacyl-[acyl-carrier protein] reductase